MGDAVDLEGVAAIGFEEDPAGGEAGAGVRA